MKRNWILWGTALFTLTVIPALCQTTHWEYLGKHPQGDMYLNRDSVHEKADVVTFWMRRVYYQTQESKVSKMKFREQWVLQELDCHKHTMKMNQMLFKDAKGKLVGTYSHLNDTPKPIQPKGFFEKEEKLLCPAVGHPAPAEGKPHAGKPEVHKPESHKAESSKSEASQKKPIKR